MPAIVSSRALPKNDEIMKSEHQSRARKVLRVLRFEARIDEESRGREDEEEVAQNC